MKRKLLQYTNVIVICTNITDTLSKIIFYAQAANCGLLDMLTLFKSSIDHLSEFAIFIICFLNLYNGMTEL